MLDWMPCKYNLYFNLVCIFNLLLPTLLLPSSMP